MWTYFKIVMTLIKIPVEAQPISVLYWKRMNVCDHEQYLGALIVKKKKKSAHERKMYLNLLTFTFYIYGYCVLLLAFESFLLAQALKVFFYGSLSCPHSMPRSRGRQAPQSLPQPIPT